MYDSNGQNCRFFRPNEIRGLFGNAYEDPEVTGRKDISRRWSAISKRSGFVVESTGENFQKNGSNPSIWLANYWDCSIGFVSQ